MNSADTSNPDGDPSLRATIRAQLTKHGIKRERVAVFFRAWEQSREVECVAIGRVAGVQVRNVLIAVNGDCTTNIALHHVLRVERIARESASR